MKKFFWIALGATALSGCVDSVSDVKGPDTPAEVSKVTELVVPASFDWKTTAAVACAFTAPAESTLAVSLAEGAEPFATVGVGPDAEPVVLDVPASTRTLYVSYAKADGSRKGASVSVVGGKASFALGADAAAPAGKSRGGNDYDRVIYYPAMQNGWGTFMFEDLWPAYGDYDFNDFVLNYKIQLYANNKNMVKAMLVGLRVKAIGGTLPFIPRLRMLGVKGGEIDAIDPYDGINIPSGAELVQLNPGNSVKEPAVLEFRGIATKAHRPAGSAYLNTEEGKEMADDELVTVSYYIELRNSVKQSDVKFESFDFFLADAEGKEIHLGGVEPTADGRGIYDRESQNANTAKAPSFYYSNDRLVWAIHIPEDAAHAYEKTDFLKAYPRFAEWVQSGGMKAQTWYEQGDEKLLVKKK